MELEAGEWRRYVALSRVVPRTCSGKQRGLQRLLKVLLGSHGLMVMVCGLESRIVLKGNGPKSVELARIATRVLLRAAQGYNSSGEPKDVTGLEESVSVAPLRSISVMTLS